MRKEKGITGTMEDYLEAVLTLQEKNQPPRIKTISKIMNVTKPTAHSAIASLMAQGYLTHETYGHIELTTAGKELAEKVYNRHKTLTRFLRDILKINATIAENEACGMEHAISEETIEKLKRFINFYLSSQSQGKANCRLERFHKTLKRKK